MGGVCTGANSTFEARYRLCEQIGKGSQGKVNVCFDRQSSDEFAVKILDRSSRNAYTTFRREVDLLKTCEGNPNIVRVVDEFTDSLNYYVVMDRYAGHLRKALRCVGTPKMGSVGLEPEASAFLSDTPMRRVFYQATQAIAYLHSLDIAHRDVKAQNFLVDRLDLRDDSVRIVLSDFGLAKQMQPGQFLNAQVGTRKYWAPELYDKHYWHVVDCFALGVMLYLASTASYPYEGEEQVRHRDIFADEAIPDILTAEAKEYLRRSLVKDPTDRATAAELLNSFWLMPRTAAQLAASKGDGREEESDLGTEVVSETTLTRGESSAGQDGSSTSASGSFSSSSSMGLALSSPCGNVDGVPSVGDFGIGDSMLSICRQQADSPKASIMASELAARDKQQLAQPVLEECPDEQSEAALWHYYS